MVYVTSDLHGCSVETLKNLLWQADFSGEDYLFILGDVIDRGEHGAQLLLWLTEQTNVQLILGNHEAMLLSCAFLFQEATEETLDSLTVEQMCLYENWAMNGCYPTVQGLSRILKQDPEVFEGIMDYLREAPLYEDLWVEGKNYILTHAGLGNFHPDKPLEDYTPRELLWERPDLSTRYFSDATVVFGHTPTELFGERFQGRAVITSSWICIDTGAGCGGSPMLLRLDDGKMFYAEKF